MVRPIIYLIRGPSGLVLANAEYSLHIAYHEWYINAMSVKKKKVGILKQWIVLHCFTSMPQKSRRKVSKFLLMYFNTLTIRI